MKYCKKCVMPDTRPGIVFDSDGVCSACRAYEKRSGIDWELRWKEFEQLCDKYRGKNNGGYDCAIAVSGGKDSHFQVYLMKNVMHMNPILFSVEDNFTMTEAGKHNIKNISEEFDCNIISLKPSRSAQKKVMRYTFEKYGMPTWYIDRLIYTYPLKMSVLFNTPLLVYGENVSYEYGGPNAEDTYSAIGQLRNGVALDIDEEELISNTGIDAKDLILTKAPTQDDFLKLDPIYISYFVPWNSVSNYEFARKHGFHDLEHEWKRSHHIENYDQIDSFGYLVHSWLKYPKYGHQFATDYASRLVRYGLLTREEAIDLVEKHDSELDSKCVEDFCNFCGYSEKEFWNIVDLFYNRDIFEKDKFGKWKLKYKIKK